MARELTPTDELTEDQTAALAEIAETSKGCVRVKLHDKAKALDRLARHLGLYKERATNTQLTEQVTRLAEQIEQHGWPVALAALMAADTTTEGG